MIDDKWLVTVLNHHHQGAISFYFEMEGNQNWIWSMGDGKVGFSETTQNLSKMDTIEEYIQGGLSDDENLTLKLFWSST